MSDNSKLLANEWFKKADEDLYYARLVAQNEAPYGLACFHCQQAAEKYLKGYLTYKNIEIEKIHDIIRLLGICKKCDDKFGELTEECIMLNAYYIPTRYPVPEVKNYSLEELQNAIQSVEKIINFIKEKLRD